MFVAADVRRAIMAVTQEAVLTDPIGVKGSGPAKSGCTDE
jgi:hypothetical protein